jgi:hypothetical protein
MKPVYKKINRRKYLVSGLWITGIVVLMYGLSIGPAYRLRRTGKMHDDTFRFLYAPLNTCCDHSQLFRRIIDNYYLELWYSDTRNIKAWLKKIGDAEKTSQQQGGASTNGASHKQ